MTEPHKCTPPHDERARLGVEWPCPDCGQVWKFKMSRRGGSLGFPTKVIWMAVPFPWWNSHDSDTCPLCAGSAARTREKAHEYVWEAPEVVYARKILVDVLVYHYRAGIKGCGCGWSELGRSWPEHVVTVYEESVRARS